MEELYTMVIYDIQEDKARTKISEACLDYGLERIQYSAFQGSLSKNMREELFLRLSEILDDGIGKIVVQPICAKDRREAFSVENEV